MSAPVTTAIRTAGPARRTTPGGQLIFDEAVDRKADLVLQGGGVKGIGLAGAVLELDRAGVQFQRIAGTSAGAVAAAVIAALLRAGKPVSMLGDIMQTLDYGRFVARNRVERVFGPVGEAERLLVHLGLYDGDYLLEWLGGVLEDLGVTTFADLRLADEGADSRWTDAQKYSLVVHTSDITRGRLVHLPWDYPDYGLDPGSQRIADAVRASMSIPFFFRPVRLGCEAGGGFEAGNVTWVDGGLLSNFPVEAFDRTDGAPSRWPTIGIKLSTNAPPDPSPADCDNVLGEALACLRTALNNDDRSYVDAEKAARTIFVDTRTVSSTDFHLTTDQQQYLLTNGRTAASQWLAASRTAAV